jgi:hypothetical protein
MANWFYYDDNGQKQGPIDEEQLQILVANGMILPETRIETEDGRKAKAGKIKGLTFPPVDTVSPDNPFVTPLPEPGWACPHCGEPMTAGEKFCGSCGRKSQSDSVAPGITSDRYYQPPTSKSGFLDIGFTRFITPVWISVIWIIGIVCNVISFLISLVVLHRICLVRDEWGRGNHDAGIWIFLMGFVGLVILHLFALLLYRMALETDIVLFRIEKNTRAIRSKQQ